MRTATPTWAASTEPALSTGNSLSTTFSFGIALDQLHHVLHRPLAVAAIVIEEFDEGDVAILVAERDVARRIEDRVRVAGDAGFVLGGFRRGLTLAEFGHRLFEHFGMCDQVIPDDGLDIAALGVGEALRRSGDRDAAERHSEQGGNERAERGHRYILMRRFPGNSAEGRLLENILVDRRPSP